MRSSCRIAAIMGTAFALAGCTTYYQVREPAGGKTYYTTGIEQIREGAVRFKDGKSGANVTLQNSEVREIPEEEYEKGITPPAEPEK